MVRVEVTEAIQVLVEGAERYRRAYRAWEGAVAQRDGSVAAAERRVMIATGGLGYRRWELACSRRRIYTKDEALMVARALRARPAVGSAVAKLEQVRKGGDAAVLAARVELAGATKVLSGYGQLGGCLDALSASELRRLARRSPGPSPKAN
jgi:hypothetical protein